jgi:radical SAM protein with 4Fe4S-binding SPASM domain
MINIFTGYTCNLRCPYCFARELGELHPEPMSTGNFDKLLEWIILSGISAVAFLGGEPTLHQNIRSLVGRMSAEGITVVLFTNALAPRALMKELAAHVTNFVINYNTRSLYTGPQYECLHENLALLHSLGKRIAFSKNFSVHNPEYEYLLEGSARYGVSSIRYDIARPSFTRGNEYVPSDAIRDLLPSIADFVRRCKRAGIETGLDCCMRLCDLDVADKESLERDSMKFTGFCHPSVDIHPDLSASYCLSLYAVRVPDVTAFPNEESLRWHFAEAVQPVRRQTADEACSRCADFLRRCQGGCLAQRARRVPAEPGRRQTRMRDNPLP